MGKHKIYECEFCSKSFRSDYLKKHVEIKHSKQPINKSPKKLNEFFVHSFIDDEAVNSESDDDEIIAEETETDRNFIDDHHSEDDSEEVRQRLADLEQRSMDQRLKELGADFRDCTHCIHCKILYRDQDIRKHLKNCHRRLVQCYICERNGITTSMAYEDLLSKHVPQCRLDNKIRKRKEYKNKKMEKAKKNDKEKGKKNNKKKKAEKKKKNKKEKKEKKEKGKKEGNKKTKKKRKRKGTMFKMQFHRARKYEIYKRLCLLDRRVERKPDGSEKKIAYLKLPDWIKQFIIGNEFGSGPKANPHCHAVLVTQKPINYEDLKVLWKQKTRTKMNDLQGCKHIKTDIRYCGKEDHRPIIYNFDYDLMHPNVTAYIQASKYKDLNPTQYPYCNLPPFLKREFREKFYEHRSHFDESDCKRSCPEDKLMKWQQKVITILENKPQDDRQIMWVIDFEGNSGKSYLAKYLRLHHGAFTTHSEGIRSQDFSFVYKGQKLVVFDYPRHTEADQINYGLLEALKNGTLFSPKYESRVLHFENVQVLCFTNIEPNYLKLSADRWQTMFTVKHINGELKLRRFTPYLPDYGPFRFVQGNRNR